MAFSKIALHAGFPCNGCNGIDDYWRALNAAGVPFGVYSVENGGLIALAAQYDHADPLIYRMLATDVADYSLTPEAAAQKTWVTTMAKMPPELRPLRDRVWIEIGNEQDKNRADWLGWYYVELAGHAAAEGWRICGPGWSTGEPEPSHWETAGWLAYLRLCAASPERLAVTVHEYSLDADDIEAGYPWLVGRVQFLFDKCTQHGIAWPTVFVTEAGWTHNDLPVAAKAKADIAAMAKLYATMPTVKAAFLWTLIGGGDKKTLAAELNALMPWLQQYNIDTRFPDPEPPPGPESPKHKAIVLKVPQDVTAAEWQQAAEYGYSFRHTMTASHDDMLTILAGGNAESYVKMAWAGRQADVAKLIEAAGYAWVAVPELDTGPLDGLVLGRPFTYRYVLTSPFNSSRDYGRHEGADYDIIGGAVDNKVDVLCLYDGVVDRSLDSTGGYGKYVRVLHERNGKPFYTRYGHLDRRYVEVGQKIAQGQPVGEVGTTGNVTGEHVHINLEAPGYGLSGYVVADVVDPAPYIPSGASLPLYDAQTVDLLDYLRGDGRLYEVRHPTGSTETFQTQRDGDWFYLVKNSQWEQLYVDDDYLWRGYDTSPGNGRFYLQYEPGLKRARWCLRRMRVGQAWVGSGHMVQFYDKTTCKESAANSGPATNRMTFVARHTSMTWNGITVPDVVELTNGTETYWYGRGFGLVAWTAPWGQSAIVQTYAAGERPQLVRESIKCIGS